MKKNKFKVSTLVFVLPSFSVIFVFLLYPAFQTILFSFEENGAFVGLQNYTDVMNGSRFVGALINNLIWIVAHLPVTLLLGFFFALLFQRIYGEGIAKTFIFMGLVVPMVIGAVLVRFMFSKHSGMVSTFFKWIGVKDLHINWLAHTETALPALILTSIWLWVGYVMVMYLAGLNSLSPVYAEAAKIDGASNWTILWKITFPLLKPVTGVTVIMTLLWELKVFDLVYLGTGGGPGNASNVLALEMYQVAFKFFREGQGAALAVILTLLSLIPFCFIIAKKN